MSQDSGIGEILKYGLLAVGGYLLYEYFFAAPSAAQVATSTSIPTSTAASTSAASTGSVSIPAGTDVVQVNIDVPSPGQTISGNVTFAGWYVDTTEAITQVQVTIDGSPVGNVFLAGNRTDVCASNNYPNAIGCPNVGWSVTIQSANLSNGSHTLSVTAYSASGAQNTMSRIFNVSNPAVSVPTTVVQTPSTVVYAGQYVPPNNTTQLNAGLSGLASLRGLNRKKTVKEIMSADLPSVDWVN